MALLKHAHLYFAFLAHVEVAHTFLSALNGEYQARPRLACGGAGEPSAEQGAHEQWGFGRLLIPPAKK